jgi:hypothetical protein
MLCGGQKTQLDGTQTYVEEIALIDTLFILPLKNKQYEHLDYKILWLCDLNDEGIRIKINSKDKFNKGI